MPSYSKELYEISYPDNLGPTGMFDRQKCDVKMWEITGEDGRKIKRVDVEIKNKKDKK